MLLDFLIQARKLNVTAVTTTYWQMGTAQFCEAAQRLAGNDEYTGHYAMSHPVRAKSPCSLVVLAAIFAGSQKLIHRMYHMYI